MALDCGLADDHRPPPEGIRVQDDLIHNGYVDRAGARTSKTAMRSRMSFAGFRLLKWGVRRYQPGRLTGNRVRSGVSPSQRDASEAPVSGW
jgi:hypothetical protein